MISGDSRYISYIWSPGENGSDLSQRTSSSPVGGLVIPVNQSTQVATEKVAAPPALKPVINPDTGALDKSSLNAFIDGMTPLIPALADPNDKQWAPTDKQAAVHHQLNEHLKQIKELTNRRDVSEEQLGLLVRDQFAAAATQAQNLSDSFDHLTRQKTNGERNLAEQFHGIAAMMTELKRFHLTHAAPDVVNGYAKREADNLGRSIATLAKPVPGNSLDSSKGAGVKYGLPNAVDVGVSAERPHSLNRDDDNDLNYMEHNGVSAKGTLGVDIGKGSGKESDKELVAKANISGAATATFGGVFFEHDTLAGDKGGMLNLIVNHNANNAKLIEGRSAGPNARDRIETMDHVSNRLEELFLGKKNTSISGAPRFVHDEKLAKGYNPTKMHDLLAPNLDRLRGNASGGQWGALLNAHYPSVKTLLDQRLALPGKPSLPQNPISRTTPLSVTYRESLKSIAADVKADAGIKAAVPGLDGLGGSLGMGGKYGYTKMNFQPAVPGHQTLDPAFSKDMAQNYFLFGQMDAACAKDAVPEELHQYAKMRDALQPRGEQLTHDQLAKFLGAEDAHYYGAPDKIPAQFIGDLMRPSASRVEMVGTKINNLSTEYRAFLDNANRVLAQPDKFLSPRENADLTALRRDAIAQIYGAVFDRHDVSGDHQLVQKVMDDPVPFIAKANEAYSLALGCAGTHLTTLKRELLTKTPNVESSKASQSPNAAKQHIDEAIQNADAAYRKTRELFDNAYLPIPRKTLAEQAVFKNKGPLIRHDFIGTLSASGGASFNPLRFLKQNESATVSVKNSAGQVELSAEMLWQNVTAHPNAARAGRFWRITLKANEGQLIVGDSVSRLFDEIVKKACPGSGKEIERQRQGLKQDWMQQVGAEVLRQVQSGLISQTGAQTLQIKLHQLPGGDGYQTQYLRGTTGQNSRVDAGVRIPTPAGVFTPSVSTSQSAQTVTFERMGPDLGYAMLQHPRLVAAVEQAGGKASGALKKAFENEPDLQTKYFNNPDTIVTLLDQFHTYQQAAKGGAHALEGDIKHNPFYRYFETSEFKRTSELGNAVAHFAPGSMADGVPAKLPAPWSDLTTRVNLSSDSQSWDDIKNHIRALKSEKERMDYFCNEDAGGGAEVFRKFMDVISTTRLVNYAVKNHVDDRDYGYRPELTPELQART